MPAPGGVCVSCGSPMQWTVVDDEMWVRCRYCADLFGTDLAGEFYEGGEAEADSRSCLRLVL